MKERWSCGGIAANCTSCSKAYRSTTSSFAILNYTVVHMELSCFVHVHAAGNCCWCFAACNSSAIHIKTAVSVDPNTGRCAPRSGGTQCYTIVHVKLCLIT